VTGRPEWQTIPEMVLSTAERFGDAQAIVDGPLRLTFTELTERVRRAAGAFASAGIEKGDRVAIWAPNSAQWIIAAFGLLTAGGVLVPVNTRFKADEAADIIRRSGAKLVLVEKGFLGLDFAVPDGVPAIDLHSGFLESGDPFERAVSGSDVSDIIYTSGTTGRPKGAVHVHGGFLVKIAQEVAHQVDMHPDDRLFWVTDLGWIMGPWEITGALAAGGTVVLAEGAPDYPGPDRIWSMVERHGVTILGVSPTLIRALMRHGDEPVASHDLSRLRILASTGETWDPESWRWLFEKAGGRRCPIINFSGGTEVGACLLSALPITPLKPCSLAGPALAMAVDVFDAAGKPLRDGVGELVCTRPWPGMTRGIWGDPDRYLATYWSRWANVWVHGDWASIDADGDWFLHGRSDDTLNVAGKRLGPAEVESILAEHEAVAESAAIGVPDDLKGEVIVCFAVLKAGHAASASLREEMRSRVALALGKSFAPEDVRFVTELPKTRSGKIVRRVIRNVAIGLDPGDLSSIENLAALEAVRRSE
jgi:acetyl-CoA synthetase